jgi:hypothetical protein
MNKKRYNFKKFPMSVEFTKLLVSFKTDYQITVDEFVEYWSSHYSYQFDSLYLENIGRMSFDTNHIQELYTWKNGMKLSIAKQMSLDKLIIEKVDFINELKGNWDDMQFKKEFNEVSAIWQIFLKHIIKPEEFPIFDMHVYRAFKYLQLKEKDGELPFSRNEKLRIYEEEYLPFYWDLEDLMENKNSKKLDEALWAFGKFLSNYPKMVI